MIDFDVITGPGPETVAPRQEPPRKPTAPASLPPPSPDPGDGAMQERAKAIPSEDAG
jgi:hypothetical protein